MQTKIIKIKDIIIEEEFYPREKPNEILIKEYAKKMSKGTIFPPIRVALLKGLMYLIDGRHRIDANSYRGEDYIQSEIQTNLTTKDEIFIASIKANTAHGLRLNRADKLKVAKILNTMKYDAQSINTLIDIKPSVITHLKVNNMKKVFIGKKPVKVKESLNPKEEVPIVDEKEIKKIEELNKGRWQEEQLQQIIDYLLNEEFDDTKKIFNLLKRIKKILKKRYPKL